VRQKHADGAAALLVGAILCSGGLATWQAYQQWIALGEMDGHMGPSMTAMHGTHPVWYLLGTILVTGVISGVYLSVRDRIITSGSSESLDTTETDRGTEQQERGGQGHQPAAPIAEDTSTRQVIDMLPNDEQRILQPVLDSPGVTQIELRDRSNFSKSKVSQTVTDLEKRGLVYREPHGRTYRVYPSDEF
jgi:predicted transcriptional regulator